MGSAARAGPLLGPGATIVSRFVHAVALCRTCVTLPENFCFAPAPWLPAALSYLVPRLLVLLPPPWDLGPTTSGLAGSCLAIALGPFTGGILLMEEGVRFLSQVRRHAAAPGTPEPDWAGAMTARHPA